MRAVEREAAYIVLGALAATMHPALVRERCDDLLSLYDVALGALAKEELDDKK